mgnify:CR=1 FL=1|tara:strand:- start:2244 stop:3161 length:918 start_codon:yes stop_codon:yes gene_type:complete
MAGYTLKDSGGNAIVVGDEIIENPTLYVDDANGNDANAGASAGAGNALKTIGAAVSKIGLVFRGTATINVSAGTYREQVSFQNVTGGKLVIDGNAAADTIISGADTGSATTPTRDYCFLFDNCEIGEVHIKDFRLEYSDEDGYRCNYGSGHTTLEDVEIQNIDGKAIRLDYCGTHLLDNVDISDVAGDGVRAFGGQVVFANNASSVVNCSKNSDYAGMGLRGFYGARFAVTVAGCSFGGATNYDTYCVFLDNSYFIHDVTMTLSKGAVGVRARWDAVFTGKNTVTETNITTSSTLTTGSVRNNGS